MGKPHIHAEVIKAWADGKEIQYSHVHTRGWVDLKDLCPQWFEEIKYRIKPEPKYPETRMDGADLHEIYMKDQGPPWESMLVVANAAIRRAIEDGDVILPENKGA